MPANLPAAATQIAVDVGGDALSALWPYLEAHPYGSAIVGGLLLLHLAASAYVAATPTKSGALYRAAEVCALVIGKAKNKAE